MIEILERFGEVVIGVVIIAVFIALFCLIGTSVFFGAPLFILCAIIFYIGRYIVTGKWPDE